MEKPKILYVNQEITPYLPESYMSSMGRFLPQATQESKKEIRTFMPRFGLINERRNQLHEVIRLSGMNLIINDMDHPLIIKVASIQTARDANGPCQEDSKRDWKVNTHSDNMACQAC